jgi:Family of unknown function (DUF5681)
MTDPDGPAEETPRRYRNPPSEHRFRKGVSGNPRGRPRKTRPLVGTKIAVRPGNRKALLLASVFSHHLILR